MPDASFADFVRDQLQGLGDVDCRAMFGGYGLYSCGAFFGIISRGQLYFKTTTATRAAYQARGMKPFRPSARQTLKSYYAVPAEILEDTDQLVAWARQAVQSRPEGR